MATLAAMAAILGRLNPAIYDVIFPHGPVLRAAGARRIGVFRDEVATEPEPSAAAAEGRHAVHRRRDGEPTRSRWPRWRPRPRAAIPGV